MNSRVHIFSGYPRAILGLICTAFLFTGCARDAAKTARISGVSVVEAPATTPTIPTPPEVVISRTNTLIDAGSQGGVDDTLTHETSSGSLEISNVSVGGDARKKRASSASYKVSGGIYVQ